MGATLEDVAGTFTRCMSSGGALGYACHGVMSTPDVVVSGKVGHVGGVPSREKIEQWLIA